MPRDEKRVLLICHASAAAASVEAARKIWSDESQTQASANGARSRRPLIIDVLCYGRISDQLPAPAGSSIISVPCEGRAALAPAVRLSARLKGRRYEAVAVSQPMLGVSRARGALIAYAFVLGGRRAAVLDPSAGRLVRPIGSRLAAVELGRWLVLQSLSRAVAALLAVVIERVTWGSPRKLPAGSGSVTYLRTDIELRTAPLLAGGSVAHTEGILLALLDRGHRVAFWSTGDVDGVPSGVVRGRLPVFLRGNLPTEIAEFVSGLMQALAPPRGSMPSTFIYQRYSLNNLAGALLSWRRRIPLVLEANSSEAKWRQDFGNLQYPRLAYACERFILGRAAVIATVSRNAAEDLLMAGAAPNRLRIVPNGVTVTRFQDSEPIPLPVKLDGYVIGFVGLFYPWHGVRFLAEAFCRFRANHPQARLLLVGDGEEAPLVKALLERSGALEATHFAGLVPRHEVPRYMASVDVLVSPHADVPRFIGSPIKLFEYMAAGKPIVATRVGQIQDVLRDGHTALLVPPEDPDAMAAAFARLAADSSLACALGRAARAEARTAHSWDARLASIMDGRPPDDPAGRDLTITAQ